MRFVLDFGFREHQEINYPNLEKCKNFSPQHLSNQYNGLFYFLEVPYLSINLYLWGWEVYAVFDKIFVRFSVSLQVVTSS